MSKRVFMIGVDVIFDPKSEKISILELQTFNQCYQGPEWLAAGEVFNKLTKRYFPKRTLMSCPDEKIQTMLFQRATVTTTGIDVVDVGIEAIAYFKWIFYTFCQLHSELKPYVPKTHALTLNTLSNIPLEELKTTHLFKPVNLSNGKGIQLIDSKQFTKLETLCLTLGQCEISPPQPRFLTDFPFLMQEFLGFEKQVTRVYAMVIVDPNTGKIDTAIDAKNSYRSRLIKPDKFDIHSKVYNKQGITSSEQTQLTKFIFLFFDRLLHSYGLTHFKYWEILAKSYIDRVNILTSMDRLQLISHFCWAVVHHQRFTQNKLSLYQCFILEGFLKCYVARGDSTKFKIIEPALLNAIRTITKYNIEEYMGKQYQANEVLKAFRAACKFEDYDRKNIQPLIRQETHLKALITAKPHTPDEQRVYNCIFSFLPRIDIDQMALVNKDHLNHVAGSCRIF